MKFDPYKHQERYIAWKEKIKEGIPFISKENSDLIIQYVTDMERGLNVASKSSKGSRGFIRLNTLREKVFFFGIKFKELFGIENVTHITEDQVVGFFSDMKNGVIKTKNNLSYRSVDSYSKVFKAFWHWWMKVNRKNGKEIRDITLDLDTKQEKPDWVYLNEQEVKLMAQSAKYEYRALIMFLFDTGIRAPTEMMNVRVSDFYNDFKELNIREETSKTFGRRIKLMLCSSIIKDYVQIKKLESQDYLFTTHPGAVNQYLKRLAEKLFGNKVSPAGQKYSQLTMYDFRHCACCYWLPRYKSESALKYRFGWKKSDKIHYYSELLGMSDTISENDMFLDSTKTEIEQNLEVTQKENHLLNDRLKDMEMQMVKIMELAKQLEIAR
jgi:integrase